MNKIELVINKQKYVFVLGLGFLGELIDALDMGIDEVANKMIKNPFKYVPIVMYYSAKYNLERQGEEVTFDNHTFEDGIDADGGINIKSVSDFMQAFTKSLIKDVPQEEEKGNKTSKKK